MFSIIQSWQYSLTLMLLAASLVGCNTQPPKMQILRAIETDSAISKNDLHLIDPAKTLHTEPCKGKPLTIVMMMLPNPGIQDGTKPIALKSFPTATPAKIFQEITRNGKPLTCIHADRITSHDCVVDRNTATGSFSYFVPELYEGKIDYIAFKEYGRWRISHFILPGFDTRLVQLKDSTWMLTADDDRTKRWTEGPVEGARKW